MSNIIAPNKKNIFYASLILIICIIFGFGLIATKDLLDENFPKYLFLTLRFGIGVLVLLLIRKLIHAPKIKKTEVKYGALIGVVLFIGFVLQTTGLKYTTPANSGLFTGLSVIFVPIIMMIALRKFFPRPIIVSIFCFIGVAIISNAFTATFSMNIGDVLTIMCAVAFAFMYISLERYAPNENPINMTIFQLLTIVVLAFPLSLLTETGSYANISWEMSIPGLLYMGVLASAVAYSVQTFVQTKISATTVAVISTSESVFAVIFSVLFAYDVLSLSLVLGSTIIVLSMILAATGKQERLLGKLKKKIET